MSLRNVMSFTKLIKPSSGQQPLGWYRHMWTGLPRSCLRPGVFRLWPQNTCATRGLEWYKAWVSERLLEIYRLPFTQVEQPTGTSKFKTNLRLGWINMPSGISLVEGNLAMWWRAGCHHAIRRWAVKQRTARLGHSLGRTCRSVTQESWLISQVDLKLRLRNNNIYV